MTTSSPGSMIAIMVDIIASVDPQQTVTCSSATIGRPYRRVNSRATASRSGRAPHVTAYWLMSALMAAQAASLIAAGAGKSGNPCDRLTPPYISLRRVISRMTDSVNCVAFFEPASLDISVPILRCLLGLSRGGRFLLLQRRLLLDG